MIELFNLNNVVFQMVTLRKAFSVICTLFISNFLKCEFYFFIFELVNFSELVDRVETALKALDNATAESLVISALNQLKTSSGSLISNQNIASGSDVRVSTSSGSRLMAGMSLGLLILAQSHPTLFARPGVLDQMMTILSLNPRELGISLSVAAIATTTSRVRGLYVRLS